jgi:hypothetical protein
MKQGNFIRDTETIQYPAKPGPERTRWKVMGISFVEKSVPSLNRRQPEQPLTSADAWPTKSNQQLRNEY